MSSEKQIELKPCPFCGISEDGGSLIPLSNGIWALHHFCEKVNNELTIAISVYGNSKKEVFERWNRRADNEQRETET
jgi:hypothetical protein